MITIHDSEHLDPVHLLAVQADMEKKGVTHYTVTRGNDCLWVYHGQINLYYIFNGSKIVDIQVD